MKVKVDELFAEAGFDKERQEQITEELELKGFVFEGGYDLIYWDGPNSDSDDSD